MIQGQNRKVQLSLGQDQVLNNLLHSQIQNNPYNQNQGNQSQIHYLGNQDLHQNQQKQFLNPQDRFKQNNIVLMKTEVGEVKKPYHLLPNQNHVYGKLYKRDQESAKDVILMWKPHEQSPERHRGKDFRLINREIVSNRLTEGKQISKFIKECNNNSNVQIPKKFECHHQPLTYKIDKTFTHGIANKPPTPIDKIISFSYQVKDDQERLQNFHNSIETEKRKKHRLRAVSQSYNMNSINVNENRQSLENKELFKISRFKKIPSKVTQFLKQIVNKESQTINLATDRNTLDRNDRLVLQSSTVPLASLLKQQQKQNEFN